MAFEPDIVVTGPEPSEIALVVEVKMSSRTVDDSAGRLKSYMAAVRSPVGLLVTPERLRIYRDRYLPSLEDSIAKVGEFDVKDILHFDTTGNATADALAFERHVQSWLEALSTEAGVRELSPEIKRAVERYIVPALAQGSVRSGHPRSAISS
ncbi:MAG: hypothetical protein ABI693_30795 [Bryobacteraceae bacterium]